jgi:glycerol-3-phosphate dehydrogenase
MGNINLSQLANLPQSTTGYKYSDLTLDIASETTRTDYLNSQYSNNDLQAQYDLGAIKDSIRNIFITFPGQMLRQTLSVNVS